MPNKAYDGLRGVVVAPTTQGHWAVMPLPEDQLRALSLRAFARAKAQGERPTRVRNKDPLKPPGVCDCVCVGVGQSLIDDGVSAGRVMEMTRSAGVRGSVASSAPSSSAAWLPAGLASPALRTLSSIAR